MPGRTTVEQLYSSGDSILAKALEQLKDYSRRESTSVEVRLKARDYPN